MTRNSYSNCDGCHIISNTMLLISIFQAVLVMIVMSTTMSVDYNPYYQHLPNCQEAYPKVVKKTRARAMICPMIKDEEGFLSEWIAYYYMHGFEKFVIYNDESVDRGLDELKPFIDRGIVEVKANWTVETLNVSPAFTRNQFKKAMTIKALLESNCKNDAIAMGYDYYASLDIDEYVIPKVPGVTVVDAFSHWFNGTGRSVMCLEKFNFQSTPHILEPVNLLTIEAYQIRMKPPAKMNYYTSVSPKCMYRMNNPDFTNTTAKFIAECCHFHGCQGWDFRGNTDFCKTHFAKDAHIANGKGKKWAHLAAHINHYSRSLEKFGLKAKTWKTATGEAKEGENSEQAAKGYDIPKFLQRSVGWTHDATAIRYTCQLREVLKNITGADPYLRPGDMWYRNAEFGKSVGDPDKRGRYGRPNPPGFKYKERNPYHYHGVTQGREMI